MPPEQPRVLVLYSNPSDSSRLRLDKEHRAIDQVLRNRGLPLDTVRRVHAGTVADFARAVRECDYEIVQFSGHGSPRGFFLEDAKTDVGILVSPQQVAAIIKPLSGKLRAAIFVSCFSASALTELVESAPFVVAVTGPASDDAAIDFVTAFYDAYFSTGSIEHSFAEGQLALEYLASQPMATVLVRRARDGRQDRLVVQAFPGSRRDSILVDLTDARADIDQLSISIDQFLSILSRKIRIHVWIFERARERAILAIGRVFGIFSWENASDVVICHRILQVRADVSGEACEAWTALILAYNDMAGAKYRSIESPASPTNADNLRHALSAMRSNVNMLRNSDNGAELAKLAPESVKLAGALIRANLEMAEAKFDNDDLKSCIVHMEGALSALHDLVDGVTDSVAVVEEFR